MTTAPTIPVTVTHIPLTLAVYNDILRCIENEEYEYGRHSYLDDARRWLHYRWLVQQAEAQQPGAGE